MKTKLLSLLMVAALFVTGCSTLKPETQTRIQSAARVAAYVGATEYLRVHPETRPAFVMARDELNRLARADAVDWTTLLAIVNRLPVKELKNDRAQMIVTSAALLLSDYGGTLPVERLKELQPLASALAAGLNLALQQ